MHNRKKITLLGMLVSGVTVMVLLIICANIPLPAQTDAASKGQTTATEPVTEPEKPSYQIQNVEVIPQTDLKAGCETYAATMLLKILGFDLDEYVIADNYLDCHYVTTMDDGTMYGPDMHSAFAGTAYAGWGVYAPAMAKYMNNYLSDQNAKLKAYAYKDIPLETLCEEYVSKGVPVMIWATTDMQEPYVFHTWTVDYVDENAEAKMGDTVSWYMHEHCLVLIGYEGDDYIFADSVAGTIANFNKDLVAKRYKEMGTQCIVVK